MSYGKTYYATNKEARKAYQRAYYDKMKHQIKRKSELDIVLNPEKCIKLQDYQREYYLKNREKLLAKKRLQYRQRKFGPEFA